MSGNLHRPDPSVYASWPTPNYINPERRAWMPAYAGTLLGVSSLAVITRLWLRAWKKAGPLGLDDALLLPGWLAAIVFTVFTLISTEDYGSGTHTWDVPFSKYVPLAMYGWLAEIFYLVSTGFTKCSILMFHRRLTKGTYKKSWTYAIWVAIAVTAGYSLAFILSLIFSCSPTDAYWKSFDPYYQGNFKCSKTDATNLISGIMSVISDLYSVLLPCIMLRNLDAPRRQKIALNIIFSLGLLVVAAGAVRTYYLEKVGSSVDLTWDGYDVLIWAQLETQLSLVCASAPALRVFVRQYLSNPVMRALSSGNTDSRRTSRLTSKKLQGSGHSGSSHESDDVPLTSVTAGKTNTLPKMSEEDLEACPRYHAHDGRSETSRSEMSQSEFEYPLKSLQANRPPVAYPLRDKQPTRGYPADDEDYHYHALQR